MNKGLIGAAKLTLIFIVLLISIFSIYNFLPVSASESTTKIWTADPNGEPKIDFSPEEKVYILGENFLADKTVSISVTRPNGVIDVGSETTDPYGSFEYEYDLDGITGIYKVFATDGINTATVNFNDSSGAIWTTKNDCGDEQQDVNRFSVGDHVFINGAGFGSGSKSWSIKGTPGSCDSNIVVASGNVNIGSSGKFCFDAYIVQSGDCGVYKSDVSGKNDNYQVGDWCGKQTTEKKCDGAGCLWCQQCKYNVITTKTNLWLTGTCVLPGTDCGWHCEKGYCGATCSNGLDCSCPKDKCVDFDYYDYPSNGTCKDCTTSCYCQNGTDVGQPCHPNIIKNDARCGECQKDDDCNKLDKDYCDGTVIKHDEGKCIDNFCEAVTTTVQDCNDGLYCNGQETCLNAACVQGTMIDCSGLNGECKEGKCDESQDKCVPDYTKFPLSTPCSSSDACKVNHCDGSGSCILNYNVDCDDSNACTNDFCDSSLGCQHTPVSCDDGVGCTDDTCDTTKGCVYTPNDNNCPTDTTCADYYCDATKDCQSTYAPLSTPCESDDKFCTIEHCDGSGSCVYWKDYDCSGFDLREISACDWEPDLISATFDWRAAFTSLCIEDGSCKGHCSKGNETIEHFCADSNSTDGGPEIPVGDGIRTCTAECDGFGTECQNKCIDDVRYFSGSCNKKSCSCSFSTENCNDQDGCHVYESGCEDRDYFCAPGNCDYTYSNRNTDYNDSFVNYCSDSTIRKHKLFHDFYCESDCTDHTDWIDDQLVEDCNLRDGWYNTSNIQWVEVSRCTEKEQVQQEYRDYTCSGSTCDYSITDNQWIDTGETRDKSVIPPLNPPNKTIGDPKSECQQDEWCEWKITTLTPITLTCENSSVKWRYALDGDWKEWHFDDSPVTIYFPEESNHTLEAYCIDDCGNSTADVEKFKVEGTAFEIPLNKKWNLISIPFTLFNDDPSEVFKNISDQIASVWTYDNDQWYSWVPGVGGTLEHIRPGWGYWILSKEDTKLLISGNLFNPITTPPSKDLQSGWNLIGYYGTDWQTYQIESDNCGYNDYKYGNYIYCALNSLVDTQQGFPRWSSIWGYDNCGDDNTTWRQLETCVGDSWSINKMFAGKGYWIEMDVNDGYAPASNCMWNKEFKCSVPIL